MMKKWLTRISILIMTWPVYANAAQNQTGQVIGEDAAVFKAEVQTNYLLVPVSQDRGIFRKIKEWFKARTSEKECVDCSNNFGGICKDPKTGEIKVLPPCMNKSSKTMEEAMKSNLSTMQQILIFIYTASIIISMGSLVIGAVQLAMAESNPHKREKAWGRIKISLIVLACLGGIGTIVGLAMSVIS